MENRISFGKIFISIFVLQEFDAYMEAQNKVEKTWAYWEKWAKMGVDGWE
ncbi:glycogen/starch/alpha-glucan phosphorylase [Ligilactobacillus equi]